MDISITSKTSFTQQLRAGFSMLHDHFLHLVISITIPIFISYVLLWTVVSSFISQFNGLSSIWEFADIFSPNGNFVYYGIAALLVMTAMSLFAFTAAPVAIAKKHATLNDVFIDILRYTGSMTWYLVLAGSLIVIGITIDYIILGILLILIGLINANWIDSAFLPISNTFDTIVIVAVILFTTFAPYYIVTQNVTAWAGIKASFKLVKAHLLLSVIWIGLVTACVVAVAIPLSYIPLVGNYLASVATTLIYTPFIYSLYTHLTDKSSS